MLTYINELRQHILLHEDVRFDNNCKKYTDSELKVYYTANHSGENICGHFQQSEYVIVRFIIDGLLTLSDVPMIIKILTSISIET